MRINKYLSGAGIASRRKSEELVLGGRVKVNGVVVTNLATDIKENDEVLVDDQSVKAKEDMVYLMMHKPKGYICSVSDEKGRKTVLDLLPEDLRFVKPVGRLDYNSEGLLLLTNDGDLTFNLTHPSHAVPKTYVVRVEGEVKEGALAVLRNGVVIDGERFGKAKVEKKAFDGKITKLEVTITEGKNHEIRRMFEAVGNNVIFLKRMSIGELKLGGVVRGKYRELKEYEVDYLKSL